jgi:hypothetical protein
LKKLRAERKTYERKQKLRKLEETKEKEAGDCHREGEEKIQVQR